VKWWKDTIVPLAKLPGDRTALVVSHSGYIVVSVVAANYSLDDVDFTNVPLQTLLEQLVATAKRGGLGYAVQGQALQEHPFRSCKNTCISVIKVNRSGKGVVERYNDHGHYKRGMSLVESRDVVA
jgi:broad specificity phosphatase PhoE